MQREEEIQKEFGRIKSLENLLIDWQNSLNVISDIENNTLPTLIIIENDSKGLMEGAEIALKDADESFNKSLAKVNSLRNISNEIQAAVGIIAANIPKDQKDCPVCGAEYESDELQRRISNAISSIDPLLNSEIETNSILNGVLNKCKEQLDSAKSALSEIQNKISEAKNSIRINNININEAILPKFKESGNFADSKLWVDNKLISVNKELEGIKIQKNDLGLIPSSETVFEISTRQEKLTREIDVTKREKQDVELKLNLIKSELEKLALKLKDFNEETNKNSIAAIEGNLEGIQSLIDKENRLIEFEENSLSNESKDILNENGLVLQITSQQSEILTEWKNILKNDEPNNAVLEERKKSLNEKEVRFKTFDDKLNDLNEEIAKWKQAEKYTLLNDRIKGMCGNLSEEQYLDNLQTKFREIQSHNLNLVERRKALLDLYGKISSETESVYNYFNSVNPLWTSLLKRIVANPRFAETALSTYPYRNKPHAAVEIKLHDGKVNVMDVASEAQITDLQLTFLLSMASTYSWTPWKALLLDDPTQHHDLVHAANVFDLLRDYIVDQNFQIILGTHDTVQARFFQRKLQNDGISVKVWNLTANESGVTALLV